MYHHPAAMALIFFMFLESLQAEQIWTTNKKKVMTIDAPAATKIFRPKTFLYWELPRTSFEAYIMGRNTAGRKTRSTRMKQTVLAIKRRLKEETVSWVTECSMSLFIFMEVTISPTGARTPKTTVPITSQSISPF